MKANVLRKPICGFMEFCGVCRLRDSNKDYNQLFRKHFIKIVEMHLSRPAERESGISDRNETGELQGPAIESRSGATA